MVRLTLINEDHGYDQIFHIADVIFDGIPRIGEHVVYKGTIFLVVDIVYHWAGNPQHKTCVHLRLKHESRYPNQREERETHDNSNQ